MTKEDKELLLKDLSARLTYGVKVEIDGYYTHVLKGIDGDTISTDRGINYPLRLVKSYLRPLSSMTEEEQIEYVNYSSDIEKRFQNIDFCVHLPNMDVIDWLNAHHFDVRNLIEKGLALEAPDDMYKLPVD